MSHVPHRPCCCYVSAVAIETANAPLAVSWWTAPVKEGRLAVQWQRNRLVVQKLTSVGCIQCQCVSMFGEQCWGRKLAHGRASCSWKVQQTRQRQAPSTQSRAVVISQGGSRTLAYAQREAQVRCAVGEECAKTRGRRKGVVVCVLNGMGGMGC